MRINHPSAPPVLTIVPRKASQSLLPASVNATEPSSLSASAIVIASSTPTVPSSTSATTRYTANNQNVVVGQAYNASAQPKPSPAKSSGTQGTLVSTNDIDLDKPYTRGSLIDILV